MEYKQSLARRIVIAFMLMMVAVGGLFSVDIVDVVRIIEERLTSCDLGGELGRILCDDPAQGHNPVFDPGMRSLISGGQGSYAMLPALDQLDVGFHKVFEGDLSFHALVRDIDDRRFALPQNQSDFEAREQVLYTSVLIGCVLSITLAGPLSWMLACRVMEPVVCLARQVWHREQLFSLAPPLAPDYVSDEVGELAISSDETLGRLCDTFKREQLFTSDVSHELCTPLMVIAISCELLAEEPSPSPRVRGQLERMTKATEEMCDLVQTLLLLARAQRGEESLAPHGSLGSITDGLVQVWREQVEVRGLTLHRRDGSTCAGQFNAPPLHTVMDNLLCNATHYTDVGSTTLTPDEHGFNVEDIGVGVPEEQRERIFMPSVRGSSSSRCGESLGLGLSLVKWICAAEGWSVALSAVEPHGCRFEVLLDVA